jgi:hypothetical protein
MVADWLGALAAVGAVSVSADAADANADAGEPPVPKG